MTIKSADRTLEILAYVAKAQPVSMKEIREQLGLPRSSLHGLLGVLVEHGFLSMGPSSEYSIGLKAFEIGATWQHNTTIETAASEILEGLVAEVKQISHVGILDGTDVVYIMKQENERPVRLVSAVGKRLPAYATALGKVLMGGMSDTDLQSLFPNEILPRLTANTLETRTQLIAKIRESEVTGYCVDRGESTVGVTCFAAPIVDRDERMIAAISVSVIDADPLRWSDSEYLQSVMAAARAISNRLGYRGGKQ